MKNIQLNSQKYESDEEIYCDVCLNKEYYEDDLIVICDLCEAAVHQKCFGGDLVREVPENEWFCPRCDEILKKKLAFHSIRCAFCPELKGIIKKLNGFLWVIYNIRINKISLVKNL